MSHWTPHSQVLKPLLAEMSSTQLSASARVTGCRAHETGGDVDIAGPLVTRYLWIRAQRTRHLFGRVTHNGSTSDQTIRCNSLLHPAFERRQDVTLGIGICGHRRYSAVP